MMKIRVVIIQNLNVFTIYETLLQNVINISPIIYRNKSKMPWRNRKSLGYLYETLQVISTMYKLFW